MTKKKKEKEIWMQPQLISLNHVNSMTSPSNDSPSLKQKEKCPIEH